MLFFRSEGHIDAWYKQHDVERGETFSRDQLWALAQAWYGDRMNADYNGRTTEEAHQIFHQVGLTSPFWKLAD